MFSRMGKSGSAGGLYNPALVSGLEGGQMTPGGQYGTRLLEDPYYQNKHMHLTRKRLEENGEKIGKRCGESKYHVSRRHLVAGKEHTSNDKSHDNIHYSQIIFPSPFSTRHQIASHSSIISSNAHFFV